MPLLTGLICEHARPTADGKLDVHGVFHDLYAPGFPAQQKQLMLVLDLEWAHGDQGRHRFRVDMMDPLGRPALTVEGHSDVTPRPPDRPPPRTRVVLPLENVVFPVPGAYRFQVRLKGKVFEGPRLYLVETPEAAEA